MNVRTRWIVAALIAGLSARAGASPATTSSDLTVYLMPDRAAEVALARSAAPRAVSDSATVLVLTRQGYVEASAGSNGFVCLVARSFEGALSDLSSWWSPRVRAPHCLNPPAVRTVLPEIRQRASWVMAGVPAAEVVQRLQRAYATHELVAPEDGAMAYMMSHEQYLADSNPHWMPHVMFYFGGGRRGSEWGAGDMKAPIIDGGTDITGTAIMIPVPRWSDGAASADH